MFLIFKHPPTHLGGHGDGSDNYYSRKWNWLVNFPLLPRPITALALHPHSSLESRDVIVPLFVGTNSEIFIFDYGNIFMGSCYF
jgi:hypothetical protein